MSMIRNKNKISYTGVGPYYIAVVYLLTFIGINASKRGYLPVGSFEALRIPMVIIGIIMIALGVIMCTEAVIVSKFIENVKKNQLITTGIFAWVRNPLYAGITFAIIGLLFFQNNLFLLPLIFVYWGLMTLFVKKEEEALEKVFGEAYRVYKSKVNRCIPWFPGH